MVIDPSPYSLFPFEDHYLNHLNATIEEAGEEAGEEAEEEAGEEAEEEAGEEAEEEAEEAPDVKHGRKVARSLVKQFAFPTDVGLEYLTLEQCFQPGPTVKLKKVMKGLTMASIRKFE